jgi:hypothetical protein
LFGNRWLPQTMCADAVDALGGLPPPSPPAEKATASQDQAGQSSTSDGAGASGAHRKFALRATFSPAFCGPFIHLLWAWGDAFFHAFVPAAKALSGAYEEGIAGMLTIIKASLLGSALMLLESCTGYLTSYQTPCVEGHVCECVQYTTVYRSWLDCRDYGRVKSRAY